MNQAQQILANLSSHIVNKDKKMSDSIDVMIGQLNVNADIKQKAELTRGDKSGDRGYGQGRRMGD